MGTERARGGSSSISTREARRNTRTQQQHTGKKMHAAMEMRTARPARSAKKVATRGRTARAVSTNACMLVWKPRVRLRRALVRKGAARIRTGLLLQPLLDDVEAPDVRLHRREAGADGVLHRAQAGVSASLRVWPFSLVHSLVMGALRSGTYIRTKWGPKRPGRL